MAKGAPVSKMQEVNSITRTSAYPLWEDGFTVKNKNLFTDTAEYDCILLLEKNAWRQAAEK